MWSITANQGKALKSHNGWVFGEFDADQMAVVEVWVVTVARAAATPAAIHNPLNPKSGQIATPVRRHLFIGNSARLG